MRYFAALAVLLIAAPAGADPIGITIVQSSYAVDLTARIVDLTTDPLTDLTRARTTFRPDPVSDSLTNVSSRGSFSTAEGKADLFSTWTHTASSQLPGDNAVAFAGVTEQIAFTTGQNVHGDIGLLVTGPFAHTVGYIQLTDVTTNLRVWNYSWHEDTGTIPWTSPAAQAVAWSVGTDFLGDRLYRLDMFAFTNALDNEQTIGMNVSGLQQVPEPSTMALLLLGAGVLCRHRRRHTSGTSSVPVDDRLR